MASTAAVTLTGRFISTSGGIATGEVGVRLVSVLDGMGATPAASGPVTRVPLNPSGQFSLVLTLPGTAPLGGVYEITEAFNGVANATYYISLNFTDTPHSVDLAYLSPTGYAVTVSDTEFLPRVYAAQTYATQASLTVVTNTLSAEIQDLGDTRATKVYVDGQLQAQSFAIANLDSTKASVSYVNTGLNTKADLDLMVARLALKADLAYVDRQLADKANSTDVVTGLSTKLDKSTFNAYVAGGGGGSGGSGSGGAGLTQADIATITQKATLNALAFTTLYIGS